MSMENGVKVPDELLDKFKAQAESGATPGGDPGEIPGGDPSPRDMEILESLNDTLSWICKTGDKMAKDQGYPGLGEVPPDQLGELLTIVAKRNLPGSVIEKSPETATVAILGGVVVQNYLFHKKRENEQRAQRAKNQEPKNESN